MKQCSKCHKIKHDIDFPICHDKPDGRHQQCKECRRSKKAPKETIKEELPKRKIIISWE